MATHKIASGRTTPGTTNWKTHPPSPAPATGIYVDVDTSAAKLSENPVYITSLGGEGSHWSALGASSVYKSPIFPSGFRVFIKWADNAMPVINPVQANSVNFKWHINWIAMDI